MMFFSASRNPILGTQRYLPTRFNVYAIYLSIRGKCKGQRQRQRQPWLSKHVLESHDGTYWTRRRYSACRTGDRKQTKFYTIRIRWLFQRVQQVTTLICRFEFQTPQWSISRSNESNQWIESMNRSKESKQWIEPMNRINEHSHLTLTLCNYMVHYTHQVTF